MEKATTKAASASTAPAEEADVASVASKASDELKSVANNFLQNQRRRSSPLLLTSSYNRNRFIDFYERLKTYKPSWWVIKPVNLSPWICSRHGWICVEKDLLQCVHCQRYLSSHLPPFDDLNLYEKCCDKFRRAIISSHGETCIFRSEQVPLADCTPNVTNYEVALNALTKRYHSIERNFGHLEQIRLENCANLGIRAENLLSLSKLIDSVLLEEVCFSALFVALFGWTVAIDKNDALFCDQCLRSVGLWLFCRPESSSASNGTGESSPKRRRISANAEPRIFCPAKQHYFWCPWISKASFFSVLYLSASEESADTEECEIVPRWRVLMQLLLKSIEIKDSEFTNEQHYVLAKSLLNETMPATGSNNNDEINNNVAGKSTSV